MVLTQWETLCGLFFAFFEKIVVPILTSGGYARDIIEVICNAHNVPMDCSFQNINYDSERLKVGQTVGNRLGALDTKPTPMAHSI